MRAAADIPQAGRVLSFRRRGERAPRGPSRQGAMVSSPRAPARGGWRASVNRSHPTCRFAPRASRGPERRSSRLRRPPRARRKGIPPLRPPGRREPPRGVPCPVTAWRSGASARAPASPTYRI